MNIEELLEINSVINILLTEKKDTEANDEKSESCSLTGISEERRRHAQLQERMQKRLQKNGWGQETLQ